MHSSALSSPGISCQLAASVRLYISCLAPVSWLWVGPSVSAVFVNGVRCVASDLGGGEGEEGGGGEGEGREREGGGRERGGEREGGGGREGGREGGGVGGGGREGGRKGGGGREGGREGVRERLTP